MAECIYALSEDVIFDCNRQTRKGLEQTVLLVNFNDIDRNSTVFNDTKTRILKIYLKDGKRAYLFKGFKKIFTGESQVNINSAINGHVHSVGLRFFNIDDQNLAQINKMTNRGLYVAIVETKDKSENGHNAFEILGYDYGLQVNSGGRNYDEREGTYVVELSTPKHLQEPKALYKWLESDYRTTLVRFNNKLQIDTNDFKIFDRTFDYTFE